MTHLQTAPRRAGGVSPLITSRRPSTIRRLTPPARQGKLARSAFSLLEVVLALAIMAAAMMVCVGLVDLGVRSASEAREQTRAQELCESILGLITSGLLDVNSVSGEQSVANLLAQAGIASMPDDLDLQREEDAWLCTITTGASDVPELLKVTVRVAENTASPTPVEFTAVRWLLDPAYVQSLSQTSTTTTTGAP